jgi:hypothetical protein
MTQRNVNTYSGWTDYCRGCGSLPDQDHDPECPGEPEAVPVHGTDPIHLLVFGADEPSPNYYDGVATLHERGVCLAQNGEAHGVYVGINRRYVVLLVKRSHETWLRDRLASGLYGTSRTST